jgi:Fe-S-cluster containining protein
MKTCCQTSEVYVTPGDVRRIAEYIAQESPVQGDFAPEDFAHADFFEYRVPVDPIYVKSHADDPTWQRFVFRRDGSRRILRRRDDGGCVFLGPHGCTLPGDVRPLLCRLYPFDFNEHGIYRTLARGCPLELLRRGQNLLQALDMDAAAARAWHRQLYEEIRLEEHEEDSGFRVQGSEEEPEEVCWESERPLSACHSAALNPEP